MEERPESTREGYEEAAVNETEEVRLWLDALAIADKEEETWRKQADKAIQIYRNCNDDGQPATYRGADDRRFNILHSNIETLTPALYNSTPVPDVRRRFADDDPTGKMASDIMERCLSY